MRAFTELGVRHIRVTGGEPLVRKDLSILTRKLAALPGAQDISLSTNATLLAAQAESLRESGVERLNISLDTLEPAKFKKSPAMASYSQCWMD